MLLGGSRSRLSTEEETRSKFSLFRRRRTMEATLQSPLGQTVLEPGVVTIGSTPDSRLVVHDAKVSPHHAVVRSTEQGYTITDWGGTEGTFVNDQRLDPLVPRLLT